MEMIRLYASRRGHHGWRRGQTCRGMVRALFLLLFGSATRTDRKDPADLLHRAAIAVSRARAQRSESRCTIEALGLGGSFAKTSKDSAASLTGLKVR